MKQARVLGTGVASLCCARVLLERGWNVMLENRPGPRLPRVVLNNQTVALLEHIFGTDEAFWKGAHLLRRRFVAWGNSDTPVEIEEYSVALSGEDLLDWLRARLFADYSDRIIDVDKVDFLVAARGRPSADTEMRRRCGSRRALVADITLLSSADTSTAVIETTPRGWLFLIPSDAGRGTVQAMVAEGSADPRKQLLSLLSDSRWISRHVDGDLGSVFVFDGAPSMNVELCRRGWIAVGDEAMALDPLCGDGTGYGVRGAILAACVIDGIENGLPAESAFAHYRARLTTTYSAHLRACLSFYTAARFDASWDIECEASKRELAHLDQTLTLPQDFSFCISEFELIPRKLKRLLKRTDH